MNKQELIEKIEDLDNLYGEKFYVSLDDKFLYVIKPTYEKLVAILTQEEEENGL